MHKVHRGILVHSYVKSVIVNSSHKSDHHPAEVRLSRDNHAHRPIYTGHQDVTLCDLDGLQHSSPSYFLGFFNEKNKYREYNEFLQDPHVTRS